MLLLTLADPAWASANFPRGPGFYYSPFKIVFFLAVYLAWVRICGWVSRDIEKHEIPAKHWTLFLLGIGVAGFWLVWVFPLFWMALLLFFVAYLGATLLYIKARDDKVEPALRLLSEENLRGLFQRYLGVKLPSMSSSSKGGGEGGGEEGLDDLEEADTLSTIRFISRSSRLGGEDANEADRLARVQESKGYKAAQAMVSQALRERATDIHLEPTDDRHGRPLSASTA